MSIKTIELIGLIIASFGIAACFQVLEGGLSSGEETAMLIFAGFTMPVSWFLLFFDKTKKGGE